MTSSYGSLLAQVIPVVVLALLLEMRSILRAIHQERKRVMQMEFDAEKEGQSTPRTADVEIPRWLVREKYKGRHSRMARYIMGYKYGRLGSYPLVWPVLYGIMLLALGRSEVVALVAANGGHVPNLESIIAIGVIAMTLVLIIVFSVGLEVYIRFGGADWPDRLFNLYLVVGVVVMLAFMWSMFIYFN